MPPLSANKAAYAGFETQRKHHQRSKTGVSVAQQKECPPIFFYKKEEKKIARLYAYAYNLRKGNT